MKKYIVCATDLDYMFELINGKHVRRIKPLYDDQDLLPFSTTSFEVTCLPRELVYRILKFVIQDLVAGYHFDHAYQVILTDRFTISRLYYAIYGVEDLPLKEKIKRIAWSFRTAQYIYDEVLVCNNPDNYDFFAMVLTYEERLRHTSIVPWDFDTNNMDVVAIDAPLLEDGNWNITYHAFHPGKTFGDTLWLRGQERKGIFKAVRTMRPILAFILKDNRSRIIKTNTSLRSMFYFSKFSRFLKICFGDETFPIFAQDCLNVDQDPFLGRYLFTEFQNCV